jgi:phage terminase large subunit
MATTTSKTISFNTRGNDKQLEVAKYWLDPEVSDIGYGGSKGSAKSHTGGSLIFGDALIYPGTHYFIARKKLNDLRKYTMPTIKEVLDGWGVGERYYTFNGQDNFYTLYNGSKVFLLEAAYLPTDPDFERFGSIQMTRGWCEEIGEFHPKAKAMLQGTIGRWKNDEYNLPGKLLCTMNPSKNFAYEDYYLAKKENRLPGYRKFVQALPTDNKSLPKNYIRDLLRALKDDEKSIKRLVYGDWEYDDNPYSLYEYDHICNLFTNSFIQPSGQKYLSADIAYMGADIFVVMVWHGWRVIRVVALDKIDETAIGTKIKELAEEYKVPYSNITYDADGLRKFTANSLSKLEAAKPFINNSAPLKDKQYKNLKTECAFALKDSIEKGLIFIADLEYKRQIMSDLEQICREPTDDEGKIKLESKKELKKRTGRSPDFFDALLMRFIFELKTMPQWD